MIRRATVADVPVLVAMGLRFVASTSYAALIPADPDRLTAFFHGLLEAGVVFVAERQDQAVGMIGATVFDHPMSGERTACEVCWWVEPDARGGRSALWLLTAAEQWATAEGARRFQMIAPAGSSAGALYQRRGYSEVETTFQRPLTSSAEGQ